MTGTGKRHTFCNYGLTAEHVHLFEKQLRPNTRQEMYMLMSFFLPTHLGMTMLMLMLVLVTFYRVRWLRWIISFWGNGVRGTQIRFQPRSTSPCVVNFCCVPDLSAASEARIAKIHT